MTAGPHGSPSRLNWSSAAASSAGSLRVRAGDPFDGEENPGQGGVPGVAELLEQGKALGCGFGAPRVGVDQAAAGPFDDGDRLQRQRPRRRRPVVAHNQPGQHLTAFEVAAEVPVHAEGAGHHQGGVAVTVGAAEEGEGGADVGLLVAQLPQRLALLVPT